jgi:hypothetical protein
LIDEKLLSLIYKTWLRFSSFQNLSEWDCRKTKGFCSFKSEFIMIKAERVRVSLQVGESQVNLNNEIAEEELAST